MTATYDCIATTTLGSDAAEVNFTSISANFTDLVLISQTGPSTAGVAILARINTDTGNNYSSTDIWAETTPTSGRTTSASFFRILGRGTGVDADINNNSIVQFMNYSNTTTYKTMLIRSNAVDNGVAASAILWRSTSAITSIKIYSETGNLLSGSTFTLYGIKAE